MHYLYRVKNRLKWIKLLLFTIATSFVSYGQVISTNNIDDALLDAVLDDLFFNDQQFVQDLLNSIGEYDLLYTSATLNSNTYFAGRDSGLDQLSMLFQSTYFSSSGFNASVASVYYEKQNPNWDFVSLSAGYNNTIGLKKNVHYSASYSRYFYSDGWSDFNNSIDGLIGVRNLKRTIGASLSASYLFGKDQSIQLNSRIYGSIDLNKNLSSRFRLRPQINFLFAEQVVNTILPPPRLGAPPGILSTEEFSLLNTQVYIPISWSTSALDVEVGWNLNLPKALGDETSVNSTNFFTISLGYLLDFSNK